MWCCHELGVIGYHRWGVFSDIARSTRMTLASRLYLCPWLWLFTQVTVHLALRALFFDAIPFDPSHFSTRSALLPFAHCPACNDPCAITSRLALPHKVSANSVYGFTGATVGQLPCLPIASSTTSYGRDLLFRTRTHVEETYTVAVSCTPSAPLVSGASFKIG